MRNDTPINEEINFTIVHCRLAHAQGLNEFSDNEFDLVMINCPLNINIVTKTATISAIILLGRARPNCLSTLGIEYLIRGVKEFVKYYNYYAELDQGAGDLDA